MKHIHKILLIGFLAVSVLASSCSSGKLFGGKKSNCGCPSKKGMVGY